MKPILFSLLLIISLFFSGAVCAQNWVPDGEIDRSSSHAFNKLNQALKKPGEVHMLIWNNQKKIDGKKLEMIGSLTGLQSLTFQNNNIHSLPGSFRNLDNLRVLFLDFNPLVPDSLFAILNGLTQLKYLSLTRAIDYLPPSLGGLKFLKKLDLGENGLTSIPPEIDNLRQLVGLNLAYNNLTSLPTMNHMDSLNFIYLSNNPNLDISSTFSVLKELPALKRVFLRDCGIKHLPADVSWMRDLEGIDFTGNPIPPAEIAALAAQFPMTKIIFQPE